MGAYSEYIVQEFYVSYVVAPRGALDRRSNPTKQAPLRNVRVRGSRVEISTTSICRFMYDGSVESARILLTPKFDPRWDVVKSCHFSAQQGYERAL